MATTINKVIHRFIQPRSAYLPGGEYAGQLIPFGVQAFSYELKPGAQPSSSDPNDYIIHYVIGTGGSTYLEIANGEGKDAEGNALPELSREYLIASYEQLQELVQVQQIEALNVEYSDPNGVLPEGSKTVETALNILLYTEPKVITFTGGGTYEKGTSISTVNFGWTVNKAITSQSISPNVGAITPATLRSYTYTPTAPITTDTTFTLTVEDTKYDYTHTTATAATSLLFRYKRYWGISTLPTLTNEQILALNKELCTNRQQSRVFDCTGGKYWYIVIPAEFAAGIRFTVGGFSFSRVTVTDINLVNEQGATYAYKVYRGTDIQTGSTIAVEVL